MKELVRFENFSLTFKTLYGEIKALRNISFSINNDEIVALVGETGCGKTMTGLSIVGLLPENAKTSGKIFFKDMEVFKTLPEKYAVKKWRSSFKIPHRH